MANLVHFGKIRELWPFTTFVFLNRLDRLRAQMKDLLFLYRTHTTLTGCGDRKWPENVSRRWSRNYIESVRIKKLFFVPKIITLLGYSIKQTAFENIKPFQRYLNYSQKQHFYIPLYNTNILWCIFHRSCKIGLRIYLILNILILTLLV